MLGGAHRGLVLGLGLVAVTGAVAPRDPAPQSWRPPPVAAQAAASVAELETPVFSLRRLPGRLRREVADTRLRADVDRVVTGPPGEQVCLDARTSAGRRVVALQPDASLIPASTVKVLVAWALLRPPGDDRRLATEVRGGPPVDGQTGDVWLVGGADPLLSTADFAVDAGFAGRPRLATPLEALADGLARAGVRQVGRVLGDDSRHDGQRFLPGWLATYASRLEITPLSALTVNKGLVVGSRPLVAAPSPAAHAAATLAGLLVARGMGVAGSGEGVVPTEAVTLARIDSPPLPEVVGEMLQNSDNLAAEVLLKELGRGPGGQGSTSGGITALRSGLLAAGFDGTGLVLADGSGLDRADRLSCRLLADVLAEGGPQGAVSRQLPVAGRSGTLVDRFRGTPAEGRLRAKTGSLRGVAGLAGWIEGTSGEDALVFSLLANEVSGPRASILQDGLALALARYPQAPPLDRLEPRPPTPAVASGRA